LWIIVAGLALAAIGGTAAVISKRKPGSSDIATTSRPKKASAPPPKASSTSLPGFSEKLKKLAELRNEGVITEAEFEARKKELLDKMINS
jgi:hypothetical protein